ncbi:MAG TPA: NAD(P)/FAD-dependent oxidoreductase [Catalimonadaceae bacterium]|nr:NAD(P)/FAD-dependent oxidoreductase [Catalimonadaceae bacterium]
MKNVIVIGGGFAGLRFIETLDDKKFSVLLIDKLNHHQFQPLFYQVATSQLEPSSISFPLRKVLQNRKNLQIRMADVEAVDPKLKTIQTSIGPFPYDYLVIATGCSTNFFGNADLEKHAFGLKSTYDAITIRNTILQSFEDFLTVDDSEKEHLLNLVIAGAGPTGVELAGAFAEIKRNILPKDFPNIDFRHFNIHLLEGSAHTLNAMSDEAKEASEKYLKELGVKVQTSVFVKSYDGKLVTLSTGETIKSRHVIWAAGVKGNLIAGIPDGSVFHHNRYIVDRYNQIKETEGIFAVGDVALMETPKYPKGHPQVANVAINQAANLARNLKAWQEKREPKEFEYQDLGSMATVGKHKAVVDLPFVKFKGYFAWFVWMFLHLMLILSVRNKIIIFINWAWTYVTKDTSLRLILTSDKKSEEVPVS